MEVFDSILLQAVAAARERENESVCECGMKCRVRVGGEKIIMKNFFVNEPRKHVISSGEDRE